MIDAAAPPRFHLLEVVTRMDVGGVPAHLLVLLRELRQRGYDITLACNACSADNEAALRQLGIKVVLVDMRRLLSPRADVRGLRQLVALMRRERIDIVHTHMSKAALIGGIAARIARVPVVVNTAHNLGVVAFRSFWARALFWIYDKLLLSLTTDAVVTVSARVRKALVGLRLLPAHHVVAIPNGIDDCPLRARSEARAAVLGDANASYPVVGTIARLVWFKGLDALVAAAPRVLHAVPDCRFAIFGEGPLLDDLRAQAASLGVAERFLWLGESRDARSLLDAFDLFVLPSVSEGMPVTILEAMMAAKAVVATDVGGVGELVDDGQTGRIVPARDPQALAEALIALLQDQTRRQAMGAAGRARATSHFSPQAMAAATDALFRKLAAAKRIAPLQERAGGA